MAKQQDPSKKYKDTSKWVRIKPLKGRAYMELRDENGKVLRRK
jgi:hypothetical protein